MAAPARYTLNIVAETDERFRTFAPYVASISDSGVVALQATLRSGATAVFTARGSELAAVPNVEQRLFYSHPAINAGGAISIYAARAGEEDVLLFEPHTVTSLSGARRFTRVGPLGPTMNEAGVVAFRANGERGSGIFTATHGSIATIADGPDFVAFDGLPVVTCDGTVVFRAELSDHAHAIFRARGGRRETVATTGARFATLGRFPSANDHGEIVFAATFRAAAAVSSVHQRRPAR